MSAWKSKSRKVIKSVKLLGVRTAKETLIFTTVNFSVYSFYVEYTDGSAETIEVSPQNPNDKSKKEKAVFDNLMRIANQSAQDNAPTGTSNVKTMPSAQVLDSSKVYDSLKKLKELFDDDVITQDIYDTERQKLLMQLESSAETIAPQRDYNIQIQRKKGRPKGEARTIIVIDNAKREDIDLDMVCRILLPEGRHSICFERVAIKSKVFNINLTETNEVYIEFNPHTFSIDVNVTEK